MTEPPEGSSDAYRLGWADGIADRDPDPAKLAYGANRLNDYERGYIDSGQPSIEGRRPKTETTAPNGVSE